MKIKTNYDWFISRVDSETLRYILAFRRGFGVTKDNELAICDEDGPMYTFVYYAEDSTFPTKERIEHLKEKDNFCKYCLFRKDCKNQKSTPKDIGEARMFWLMGNHKWPKAKLTRTLKFSDMIIPKGRIVEVISERKTIELLVNKGEEIIYTIIYKDRFYPVFNSDLKFKEEKVI